MSEILLATKIHIPPLHSNLVNRQHLIRRLNDGITQCRRLTLISAPAGYGKSTLLSEWVSQIDLPVAWLSLEISENVQARFWAYFLTALSTIPHFHQAGIGEAMRQTLMSPNSPAVEALLPNLINEISKLTTGALLVLDDLHVITEGQIHQDLVFLIDHLPPSANGLHLVVASRIDPPWPLARWRVRDELTELRTSDLRFSSDEVYQFLNQVLQLKLSPRDIAALQGRTEGWIAGLQMAAISMQGRLKAQGPEGVSYFIETFSGSNRFILDYLMEEVISQQPAERCNFLQATSILEQFTASLCDTLLERQDSQVILDQVEQANLFLIPLDDERHWYRYHHLFADLLRKYLKQAQPDRLRQLHLRASRWYAENHLLSEAIIHAMQAGDYVYVNELVSGDSLAVVEQIELLGVQRYFEPLTDQQIAAQPWLGVAYGWLKIFTNPSVGVEHILQQAELGLPSIDNLLDRQRLTSHLIAIRAYAAWLRGESEKALELTNQAMENLPQNDRLTRAYLLNIQGLSWQYHGNLAAAEHSLLAAALTGQGISRNFNIEVHSNLAYILYLQGRLHQAHALCQDIFHISDQPGPDVKLSPFFAHAYGTMSLLHLEWNNLASAISYANEGVALAENWNQADTLCFSLICLSKALCAVGDMAGACATNQRAHQLATNISPWYVRGPACNGVWLNLVKGDIPSAAQCLAGIDAAVMEKDKTGRCLKARTSLLYAQEQYAEVTQALVEAMGEIQDGGKLLLVMSLLPLQALALNALGQEDEALDVLDRCLVLAEPEGYVRIFVDRGVPMLRLLKLAASRGIHTEYINQLLPAFAIPAAPREPIPPILPKPQSTYRSASLLEPLSERELQVLHLLDSPLTSEEIGRELYVSVNTVRTHIRNIYAKLGVKRRGDAVWRAKQLKLM
jgi:LuxR family maltose regulon positive regulatory protein